MWEKEKLLVMRNFSFSHHVFKSCLFLMRQNEYLWRKGLKVCRALQICEHQLGSYQQVRSIHCIGTYNGTALTHPYYIVKIQLNHASCKRGLGGIAILQIPSKLSDENGSIKSILSNIQPYHKVKSSFDEQNIPRWQKFSFGPYQPAWTAQADMHGSILFTNALTLYQTTKF